MVIFPNILGGISFKKLVNFCGERKPIFFDKTQIAASLAICLPQTPDLSLHDQRASRPLDSGKWVGSVFFEFWAHVIGLDVRNGSDEHSVCGLRDWDRCQARLFQRAVCSLRDGA